MGSPCGTWGQLLALTGSWRDEIADLRWSEVDLDRAVINLPAERVKNGVAHEIPLSAPAMAILKALPHINGSAYVLTTNGTASSSNFSKMKRRLDVLLAERMTDWRLHDLRRTCATGMAKLGISLPVIEKCLNHVSGSFAGIVAVYQKHSYAEEKRHAFAAWGARIADLVADHRSRPNVVRLQGGRRGR
jgi:integrase